VASLGESQAFGSTGFVLRSFGYPSRSYSFTSLPAQESALYTLHCASYAIPHPYIPDSPPLYWQLTLLFPVSRIAPMLEHIRNECCCY
jgi:hypothetical protein